MAKRTIGSLWDRINLIKMNENFTELFNQKDEQDGKLNVFNQNLKNISNENSLFLSESERILNLANNVNGENKEVQDQLNSLVIESGNANAEVSQARGGYDVLNSRLAFYDKTINTDPYYSEIKYEKKYDQESKTTYYVTTIPHIDKQGDVIKLKHGISENGSETVRDYSSRNNTTFTSNASVFNTTTNKLLGIQIQNGEIIQNTSYSDNYTLGIKENGTLTAYPPNISADEIIKEGVVEAITGFYPIIQNGVRTEESVYTHSANSSEKNPRQIIAQKPNKDIIFITVQGRGIDGEGMTYNDLIRICENLNVDFAYNLDGGGSTQSVIRGNLLNTPIDEGGLKERKVVDYLYVDKKSANKNITQSYNYDVGMLSKAISDVKVNFDKETKLANKRIETDGVFNDISMPTDNLNILSKSGMYWARDSTIGAPGKYSYGVFFLKESANYGLQIAFPYHGGEGEILMRRTDSSETGWTNWRTNTAPTPWVNFTLMNNWQNSGGSDPIASYTVKDGIVHLRGLVKNGTTNIGTVIAELPNGVKPKTRHIYPTITSGAEGYEMGRIFIETTGQIKFMNGGNNWVVLTTSFPIN